MSGKRISTKITNDKIFRRNKMNNKTQPTIKMNRNGSLSMDLQDQIEERDLLSEEEQLEIFNQSLDKYSDAMIKVANHDLQGAIDFLDDTFYMDPTNFFGYFGRAKVYLLMENPEQANAQMEMLLENSPWFAQHKLATAIVFYQTGKPKKAVKMAKTCFEDDTIWNADLTQDVIWEFIEKFEDKIPVAFLPFEVDLRDSMVAGGWSAMNKNNLNTALRNFEFAIGIDLQHVDARLGKSKTLFALGNQEAGAAAYLEYVQAKDCFDKEHKNAPIKRKKFRTSSRGRKLTYEERPDRVKNPLDTPFLTKLMKWIGVLFMILAIAGWIFGVSFWEGFIFFALGISPFLADRFL
jgi:tetratricopeptide (TPR) repeat protein